LLRYYPQFTREYIEDALPLDEGWALLAVATENDGWLQFSGLKRTIPGYMAQEIATILKHGQ
jgi:hypothetical protein